MKRGTTGNRTEEKFARKCLPWAKRGDHCCLSCRDFLNCNIQL